MVFTYNRVEHTRKIQQDALVVFNI